MGNRLRGMVVNAPGYGPKGPRLDSPLVPGGGPRKSSPPPISSRRLTLNWRRSIPFHPYCDMKNEQVNCLSKAQYGVGRRLTSSNSE
ncbi:unnamed protein product [Timema podura]|uniref:Uncharacterized protein n=1 Tax=Timema podura TaxID=61482 RepID=A0ABN7NIY6_TIMPD|nr:unnamed protein product [Timema podura]